MEGEEIGMVLGRALELKNKFNDCIIILNNKDDEKENEEEDSLSHKDNDVVAVVETSNIIRRSEKVEEEEEEESLVNIRDAFEALEHQLSSLQALQQQQRYERESSLFEIDRSRKMLLSKLKEYKGDNLDVIHEALTFAGGIIDRDDDLLLPPYPSHLPRLFVMDDHYPSSSFPSKYKLTRNGVTGEVRHEACKSEINVSEEVQRRQPTDKNKHHGLRHLFGLLAKSALTFVSVVAVLGLAGFKPMLRKDRTQFKIQEILRRPAAEERRQAPVECPPGKVLVIEEGRPRCLVKERVEIPFDLDVTAPKINYGFG